MEPKQKRSYGLSQLQRIRNWRGLSQSGLSDVSGVKMSTIQKHERGIMTDVWLSVAEPLADALEVPVRALHDVTLSNELLKQSDAKTTGLA